MNEDLLCASCDVILVEGTDPTVFRCPACNREYHPDLELVKHADYEIEMSNGPDYAGAGLLAAEEEDDSITDMLYKSAKHKPMQGYTSAWDSDL